MITPKKILLLSAMISFGLLSACTPRQVGVTRDSLYSSNAPDMSITANAPYKVVGYGKKWPQVKSDILGVTPVAAFEYAVFSDSESGPVRSYVQAATVTMQSPDAWYFAPESFPGTTSFGLSKSQINGDTWTEQLMVVDAPQDWFTQLFAASGRQVPQVWLAKRWSTTPDDYIRVVAEYREPLPDCLLPLLQRDESGALRLNKDMPAVAVNCGKTLEEFSARAAKAVKFGSFADVAPGGTVPNLLTNMPENAPNVRKLAGEVRVVSRGGDRGDFLW